MAKGLQKPIARSTDTRADMKLERVFVDLSGKTAVPRIGETVNTGLIGGVACEEENVVRRGGIFLVSSCVPVEAERSSREVITCCS